MPRSDSRDTRLAGVVPRRGERAGGRLHGHVNRHEGEDHLGTPRNALKEIAEPGKRRKAQSGLLSLAQADGWIDRRGRRYAPDMLPGTLQIVKLLRRRKQPVAVVSCVLPHKPKPVERHAPGDLDASQVEQMRVVVELIRVVEPGWEGARGQTLSFGVRIRCAPGRVKTENQRFRVLYMPEEQVCDLRLLPRRAGVEPKIRKTRVESFTELAGVKKTNRRSPKCCGVVAPAADDLWIHKPLIDVHDRAERPARRDAKAIW